MPVSVMLPALSKESNLWEKYQVFSPTNRWKVKTGHFSILTEDQTKGNAVEVREDTVQEDLSVRDTAKQPGTVSASSGQSWLSRHKDLLWRRGMQKA